MPADAPERLTRIGMETHLFELIGDAWFTYSDRVKAVLRLVACAKHGGTPLHKLCEQSNFDVKLRWMIGLPADMEGISVVEADRAMVRGL